MTKGKRNRGKKFVAVLLGVAFFALSVLGILQAGVAYTRESWQYWYPDYAKTDILPLLVKTQRTDEDYETLYAQTGLTRLGIDDMLAQGKLQRILSVQDGYFADRTVESRKFNLFTYQDETDTEAEFCLLKTGDIVVTANTWVSWWRHGHAALVVEGARGLVIESIGLGSKSECNDIQDFAAAGNFMILRPKADAALKKEVAAYAMENLVGLPYRLTTGVLSKKYKEEIAFTQCAHLVWYAYKKFGVDLDSDGGGVIKPRDMALSSQVELVQVYGFDPISLWN